MIFTSTNRYGTYSSDNQFDVELATGLQSAIKKVCMAFCRSDDILTYLMCSLHVSYTVHTKAQEGEMKKTQAK